MPPVNSTSTPFYETIDEVLAPPSRKFVTLGSGLLLFVFAALAVMAASLHYDEGLDGVALSGTFSSIVVRSPPGSAVLERQLVTDSAWVLQGDALFVCRRGAILDTIRAAGDGRVRLLRLFGPGDEIRPGADLCRITAVRRTAGVKIVFRSIDTSARWLGKTVLIGGTRGWRGVIASEPYQDIQLAVTVVDVRITAGPDSLPLRAEAFLPMARKTLLARLLNY